MCQVGNEVNYSKWRGGQYEGRGGDLVEVAEDLECNVM